MLELGGKEKVYAEWVLVTLEAESVIIVEAIVLSALSDAVSMLRNAYLAIGERVPEASFRNICSP